MLEEMKLHAKLYAERVSNSAILRHLHNPLREYEEEMIEGAIVDIGCGQSPFLLDFANTGRKLIAIDNEQIQLDYLKARVEQLDNADMATWQFCNQDFPKHDLPDLKYSLIIFSNFLHFFSLDECIEIGKLVCKKSSKGTLIYVSVHSDKFYANKPADADNNSYFRHYFTSSDLNQVFPNSSFERLYNAEIEKKDPRYERNLDEEWLEILLREEGITDPYELIAEKVDYFVNKSQSDIIAIYRKI